MGPLPSRAWVPLLALGVMALILSQLPAKHDQTLDGGHVCDAGPLVWCLQPVLCARQAYCAAASRAEIAVPRAKGSDRTAALWMQQHRRFVKEAHERRGLF